MALLPYSLRPSVVIRRNALRRGILGPSSLWKFIAVFVFGRKAIKRFFGKNAENLGTRVIGVGQILSVASAVPLSRRDRRRRGITLASERAAAVAELEAAQNSS